MERIVLHEISPPQFGSAVHPHKVSIKWSTEPVVDTSTQTVIVLTSFYFNNASSLVPRYQNASTRRQTSVLKPDSNQASSASRSVIL